MPIATGVVGDLLRIALTTAQHVTAERGRATPPNGRHGLELPKAEVPGVLMSPRRPVVAEDIRNLQGIVRHRLTRRSDIQILEWSSDLT
ncbi:MAG: hypothetical protein ACI915_004931 [Gammaproteobacteria bacterium]|jgi:hypothetical protein